VAAVDTESFKVVRNLEAGANPIRIALQPDGRYLWIGNDGPAGESWVTVLETGSGKMAARIAVGAGHHEITFTDNSNFAYVSSSEAGTVTVIDVQERKVVRELKTGSRPSSMAFSALGKALYVAHEGDGAVVVVDGVRHEVISRVQLEPGIGMIRFVPGGRWGFVVNGKRNRVAVIDASGNTLAYESDVGDGPSHVSFSEEFAYIRSHNTAEVTLFPLNSLGKGELAPLRVSGGSAAPTESTFVPARADNIVPTPEGHSVLIASPADATVVYYMEGMGVPMGSFRTYGHMPRAVSVVNRQLRETAPGTYTARVKLPASGRYDAVLFLDSPRLVQCFEFEAAPNPALTKLKSERPLNVEFLVKGDDIQAGKEFTVRFRMTDAANGKPVAGLQDVRILATLTAAGSWQETLTARPLAEGVYEASIRFPRPGLYTLYLAVPSQRLKINQLPTLNLRVGDGTGKK
jgi:YVTN family beta-propeller protein